MALFEHQFRQMTVRAGNPIILTSEETINDSRHVIHILGNAGASDGKTSYIKHKCMNSTIFDLVNPLSDRAEIAALLLRG